MDSEQTRQTVAGRPDLPTSVAATSPDTGLFSPVEVQMDPDGVLALFDLRAGVGRGYLELRSAAAAYPVLTVGLRDGRAVLHCFTAADTVALLEGDGSALPNEDFDLPIFDEAATFTGRFIVAASRARHAIIEFIETGNPAALGRWQTL